MKKVSICLLAAVSLSLGGCMDWMVRFKPKITAEETRSSAIKVPSGVNRPKAKSYYHVPSDKVYANDEDPSLIPPDSRIVSYQKKKA